MVLACFRAYWPGFKREVAGFDLQATLPILPMQQLEVSLDQNFELAGEKPVTGARSNLGPARLKRGSQ